jgi:uncharacterized protein (TIRG00374 family)
MSRKGRWFVLFKLLFSAALIWFLYHRIPLAQIRTQLTHVDFYILLVPFTLLFVNTFISAFKWWVLLDADSIEIPLKALFVSYMIGTFFNIFLPSNIGGDSYRMYDVSKVSKDAAGSVASVLADRLSGFLALVILALISGMVIIRQTNHLITIVLPVVLLLVLISIVWAFYRQTPIKWLLNLIKVDRYPALVRFLDRFLDAFVQYGKRPVVVCKIMALSFVFQVSLIVCVYLMAISINARVPFVFFSAFVPIITLMEAIPISVYGVGIRDAGYVFFFGMAGLSAYQTRSLALLFLGLTVCYALIGGVILAVKLLSATKMETRE